MFKWFEKVINITLSFLGAWKNIPFLEMYLNCTVNMWKIGCKCKKKFQNSVFKIILWVFEVVFWSKGLIILSYLQMALLTQLPKAFFSTSILHDIYRQKMKLYSNSSCGSSAKFELKNNSHLNF